jgi:hypothetical protein
MSKRKIEKNPTTVPPLAPAVTSLLPEFFSTPGLNPRYARIPNFPLHGRQQPRFCRLSPSSPPLRSPLIPPPLHAPIRLPRGRQGLSSSRDPLDLNALAGRCEAATVVQCGARSTTHESSKFCLTRCCGGPWLWDPHHARLYQGHRWPPPRPAPGTSGAACTARFGGRFLVIDSVVYWVLDSMVDSALGSVVDSVRSTPEHQL